MRTLGAMSQHCVILVFSRSLWPLFGNETVLGLQTAAQGQTTKVARCVGQPWRPGHMVGGGVALKRGCRTDLANRTDWSLLPFYPFPDQAAEAPGKAWKMGPGGTRPQLSLSCLFPSLGTELRSQHPLCLRWCVTVSTVLGAFPLTPSAVIWARQSWPSDWSLRSPGHLALGAARGSGDRPSLIPLGKTSIASGRKNAAFRLMRSVRAARPEGTQPSL